MSSPDLKLEGPTGHTLTDKTFHLLPILDILPEKAPYSTEVWSFGEVCIELAEQSPYHPSQLKLAALLEHLRKSTRPNSVKHTPQSTNTGQYFRYQRLGESLRDSLSEPDPENPSEYINFHAFAANLHEHRIFPTNPTWAIWAQRDAHETRREGQGSLEDAYVLAAAQWILSYGQSIFKQVLFPGDVSPEDLRLWSPGPLYDGKASLSLHRWHFWRDGFNTAASVYRGKGTGLGQDCKIVAAKAAEMMDSLESNMTF